MSPSNTTRPPVSESAPVTDRRRPERNFAAGNPRIARDDGIDLYFAPCGVQVVADVAAD